MKTAWIRKSGARRVVVFFCGFACDADFLRESDFPDGCDAVSVYDYTSLDFDLDLSEYPEIGVAAWSFGVWAADLVSEKLSRADARAAICGSPLWILSTSAPKRNFTAGYAAARAARTTRAAFPDAARANCGRSLNRSGAAFRKCARQGRGGSFR